MERDALLARPSPGGSTDEPAQPPSRRIRHVLLGACACLGVVLLLFAVAASPDRVSRPSLGATGMTRLAAEPLSLSDTASVHPVPAPTSELLHPVPSPTSAPKDGVPVPKPTAGPGGAGSEPAPTAFANLGQPRPTNGAPPLDTVPAPTAADAPPVPAPSLHPVPEPTARSAAPTAAPSALTSGASVYKRTHFSVDAAGDGAWLTKYFGLPMTYNYTFYADDDDQLNADAPPNATGECATRVVVNAMPTFEIHFFESSVAPDGSPAAHVPVAEWVDYWHRLHDGFQSGWDQFMANSITFYAPDLTPFVRALRGGGVATYNSWYYHSIEVAIYR